MRWCYIENGQQRGPVSADELQALTTQGVVNSDTLVWTDGMANWATYEAAMEAKRVEAETRPPMPLPVNEEILPPIEEVKGTGGLTKNSELRAKSWRALSGNSKTAMLAVFLFGLVISVSGFLPILGPLLVTGPLMLGLCAYMLMLSRGEPMGVGTIFEGFSHYGSALLLHLITSFLTFFAIFLFYLPFTALFLVMGQQDPETMDTSAMAGMFVGLGLLWMLLVAFVFMYFQARFAMAFFSLVDTADGAIDALKIGWGMTKGKSVKLMRFYIFYGLIGMALLLVMSTGVSMASAINETLGAIVILFMLPFMVVGMLYIISMLYTGLGCFYDDLKPAESTEKMEPAAS